MLGQVAVLGEGGGAQMAAVRALARVDKVVREQDAEGSEALATRLALKWSLPRVYTEMRSQRTASAIHLPASWYRAGKGRLERVGAHVVIQ